MVPVPAVNLYTLYPLRVTVSGVDALPVEVIVVLATVWVTLTLYVPIPPVVPLICPVIVVLPATPVPLKAVPITIYPEVIAVTVKVVLDVAMEPVNTAVLTVRVPGIVVSDAFVDG